MAAEDNKSDPNEYHRPLKGLGGQKPPGPEWFEWALATPSDDHVVEVKGANIAYTAWGERGNPGLLFIHGGRAHRDWWRPFAPFFSAKYRVAAIDLAGMGDSDWRDLYSLNTFVDEVFAVIDQAGLNEQGRPIVVGHSFGGWVTLASVERDGEKLRGAIIVDSPLGKPDPKEGYNISFGKNKDGSTARAYGRIYETMEEPIERFRLLPNQPNSNLYLIDHVARTGLRQITDENGVSGWCWKFDPARDKRLDIHFERNLLRAARCPLAFIYGEKSAFAQGDALDHMREQAAGRSPFVDMPDVYHHLMLDAPIAFVSTIRTLLSCWPIKVGA